MDSAESIKAVSRIVWRNWFGCLIAVTAWFSAWAYYTDSVDALLIFYIVLGVFGCCYAIIGLISAYRYGRNATGPIAGHMRYVIRTFWITILYSLLVIAIVYELLPVVLAYFLPNFPVAASNIFVALMYVSFYVLVIFYTGRMVRAYFALLSERPIANPATWLV
jgi:uncharacterized membrane protein